MNFFKAAVYLNNQWDANLFYMNLTAATDKFTKGWKESYQADDSKEWDFTYDDNCFIKFTLEEQDTDATSQCVVDVPCTDTPFAYAPCWVKGASDTANDDEYGHGYYVITYSIESAYAMDDWGTCDIYASCGIVAFGIGIWCYEY
jgi:hypothetical protein